MLYQSISAFFAALTHANIQVPGWIDKPLAWVFVTPHFHKIHHHYIQPHTDSNYGNIFSIWDHLFRTVTRMGNMDDLVYGIDTHMSPEEHSSIKFYYSLPVTDLKKLWINIPYPFRHRHLRHGHQNSYDPISFSAVSQNYILD